MAAGRTGAPFFPLKLVVSEFAFLIKLKTSIVSFRLHSKNKKTDNKGRLRRTTRLPNAEAATGLGRSTREGGDVTRGAAFREARKFKTRL